VADEWTPQYRLEKAREREHVVAAIVRAQTEWRDILDVVEAAESADAAQKAVQKSFGFSREQAMAVMDTQFRRVSHQDRTRIADELAALRAEIEGLERDL
jgi:DNA gyrase/topoisomerase IV subunit A